MAPTPGTRRVLCGLDWDAHGDATGVGGGDCDVASALEFQRRCAQMRAPGAKDPRAEASETGMDASRQRGTFDPSDKRSFMNAHDDANRNLNAGRMRPDEKPWPLSFK
ncbi:MAG: hypothetical protein VW891_16145, partial [Novosphingobium sp.]